LKGKKREQLFHPAERATPAERPNVGAKEPVSAFLDTAERRERRFNGRKKPCVPFSPPHQVLRGLLLVVLAAVVVDEGH